MSGKVVSWAVRQRVGDARRKILLTILAEHADDSGACYPGQARLAVLAECSVDTVARHLARLEHDGFLMRRKRGGKGNGRQSDVYQLTLSREGELTRKLVRSSSQNELSRKSDDANPHSYAVSNPAQLCGPNRQVEPSLEEPSKASRSSFHQREASHQTVQNTDDGSRSRPATGVTGTSPSAHAGLGPDLDKWLSEMWQLPRKEVHAFTMSLAQDYGWSTIRSVAEDWRKDQPNGPCRQDAFRSYCRQVFDSNERKKQDVLKVAHEKVAFRAMLPKLLRLPATHAEAEFDKRAKQHGEPLVARASRMLKDRIDGGQKIFKPLAILDCIIGDIIEERDRASPLLMVFEDGSTLSRWMA